MTCASSRWLIWLNKGAYTALKVCPISLVGIDGIRVPLIKDLGQARQKIKHLRCEQGLNIQEGLPIAVEMGRRLRLALLTYVEIPW